MQMTTLEWMPIFPDCGCLRSMSAMRSPHSVWIGGGRILYTFGYAKAAEKRGRGFGIQARRRWLCSSAR
jgi:glutathione S-transferase